MSGEPKAFQVAKVMSAEGPTEGKGRARAGRALPAVLKHWAFRLRSTRHVPGYKAGRGAVTDQPCLSGISLLLQKETLKAKGEGCR